MVRRPLELYKCVVDEHEGRKMSTIREVVGAGHHVVQEDPRGVAQMIWDIVTEEYTL